MSCVFLLHTSLTLPQVPDDYKIINVLWLSARRTRKGGFGVVAFSYQVRVFWQLCHLCPLVSMSVAGSGKTAAFMVPILSQICVRGRELMSQNSVCDLTFLYLPTILLDFCDCVSKTEFVLAAVEPMPQKEPDAEKLFL